MEKVLLILTLFQSACLAQAQDSLNDLDKAAIVNNIETALANRVDEAKNTVGIIVGILDTDGRQYLTRGVNDLESEGVITEDTIFEIGSLTKILTSLLLADMVDNGELALDDPIEDFLPGNTTAPQFNGKSITLLDLATHTSGLPYMPEKNLDTFSDLYDYLSAHDLQIEPGTQYQYSNLGFGLLGHLLSLHAGANFETLLTERIFEPLNMNSTTISLSEAQRNRIAMGYDRAGNSVGLTDVFILAGAGAVRSTARDMLTLSEVQLGLADHSLQAAMRRMLSITRPMPRPDRQTHMGWIEIDNKALFHIGATRGFASSFTLRQDVQRAVIVLSNSPARVDTIALHGVLPEIPITFFVHADEP